MPAPKPTPGVDLGRLQVWFASHVAGFEPVEAVQIAGGHSNITVLLTGVDGRHLVLRRPPLHSVLATAHDMGREYRLISALGPTPVPVPLAIASCPDPDVIGAPFYVMEHVEGLVMHDHEAARQLPDARRLDAALSFVDALVELHQADIDEIGLGDLARRDEYIARQLKRWYAQYQQSASDPDVRIDHAHDILAARIPEQQGAAVVHGDFRLGNCIVGPDGTVRAVLDWEVCTLGDPLADVGYVLATWPENEDESGPFPDAPSLVEGFPPRAVLLERYADRTGRDLAPILFYVAFSHFRAACITQGVYARMRGGAQGIAADLEQWRARALASVDLAARYAAAL